MTNFPLVPINNWSSRINNWSSRIGQMSEPMANTRAERQEGSAWSLPFSTKKLSQPQDGSVDRRRRLAMISSHVHTNLLNEPEDARITGGTRSLTRRLLGLNIMSKRKTPEAAAGSVSRTEVA
jgi:hypothetical protein